MDRDWNSHVQYDVHDTKHNSSIDITKISDRKENSVFSKYPMRISFGSYLPIKS